MTTSPIYSFNIGKNVNVKTISRAMFLAIEILELKLLN